MNPFQTLFPDKKPLIGVIHLSALPGSPGYGGSMDAVVNHACGEAAIYQEGGVDSIIIENFNDAPFFPDKVPVETVAAMAAVSQELRNVISIPLGVNVLRNDAQAAIAIAAATSLDFIRVNVHIAAVLADQGIIQGRAHETLRLRKQLGSKALILADVGVKHAVPLANLSLEQETRDLSERGQADAVIVSGAGTGQPTNPNDLSLVKANSSLPILIGSGVTFESLPSLFSLADGFIVGSWFKMEGRVHGKLDPRRVARLVDLKKSL